MVPSYANEVRTERKLKDRFMATHPESPFVDARVPGFTGLHYFPYAPRFRVTALLGRLDSPRAAYLRTNRDNEAEMRYVGDLRFTLLDRPLRLRVFHAIGSASASVFVPFRDLTSGRETYGPGRYLTIDLNESDEYDLDFNRAFNPYSAYTDAFECGFPPPENDLPVRVLAGERVWSGERNPATPETAVREMTERALRRTAKPEPRTPPRPRRRRRAAR